MAMWPEISQFGKTVNYFDELKNINKNLKIIIITLNEQVRKDYPHQECHDETVLIESRSIGIVMINWQWPETEAMHFSCLLWLTHARKI